jgi:hypothetical protein
MFRLWRGQVDAICRHCGKKKVNRPRGLCWACYYTPGVKELYPVTSKFAPRDEPTEAELEAMIAEQMRPENLPDWWEAERCRAREVGEID